MATFPFPHGSVGTRLKAVTDRTRPPMPFGRVWKGLLQIHTDSYFPELSLVLTELT